MIRERGRRATAALLMLGVLLVIRSLPGVARLCSSAGLVLVVCRGCGQARFVASPGEGASHEASDGWPAVERAVH